MEKRGRIMSDDSGGAIFIEALLEAMESAIIPLTRIGVSRGNKIFGAALLRKSDLKVVIAETNNEMQNPLWHGEIHAIKRFYELPASGRPPVSELIFLSTHEPCSMCLSAITWAGFDNIHYFFSHEDSRDAFAIPHDLRILKQVFKLEPGGYNRTNEFWNSHAIREMIEHLPTGDRDGLRARAAHIADEYKVLSDTYQANKSTNSIPLR
jgi:tRNA(Arg) A34 adenosine deaminase TadA